MTPHRMRYLEAKRGRVEIIPMIDVMLFLLVFFIIVALHTIPDAGAALQLPDSAASERLDHPEVIVNVGRDGTMNVGGQAVTAAELTARLRGLADPAKAQVTIAAAKDAPMQAFLRAMDACRAAGVSDIGIAAQPVGAVAESPAAP